jgi:glycosyltransferase involved in cell wall biosynthesis
MEEKFPLSVVILTRNEENRIARCLESVSWADEIIVVDDESADKTLEIVKGFTEKVFVRKMDNEGRHRNWAYSKAANKWVLSLDADEIATPELKEEIKKALKDNPKKEGFTIPIRNYIGSYWVRYGGWYPASKLRLFRKDKFRYEEVEVHPRALMEGPCGHLKSDIVHFSYKNMEEFWNSVNVQTTREAQKWYNQGKPMRLGRFVWRTIDRFLRTYLRKKGYKDGLIGFIVAFNAGLYQFLSYLKYQELLLNKKERKNS